MTSSVVSLCLLLMVLASVASACQNLPPTHRIGNYVYNLHQKRSCPGPVAMSFGNLYSVNQCIDGCRRHKCVAISLYKRGDMSFGCNIITNFGGLIPDANAACYVRTDIKVF
ncbi:hypothetical protein RB195_001083 [Necator americanus]|uniref:Uncharacterized protein n=2 Tax=Necator americanus TaxID=51031 RepID=W2TZ65_NECAM|nr:hypothetical protein NECAME_16379 [Necator americanus]ETN86356.1 hypothetical protein NECAME_16379 [Necator americanus]